MVRATSKDAFVHDVRAPRPVSQGSVALAATLCRALFLRVLPVPTGYCISAGLHAELDGESSPRR